MARPRSTWLPSIAAAPPLVPWRPVGARGTRGLVLPGPGMESLALRRLQGVEFDERYLSDAAPSRRGPGQTPGQTTGAPTGRMASGARCPPGLKA